MYVYITLQLVMDYIKVDMYVYITLQFFLDYH